jgi:hypothetical protein
MTHRGATRQPGTSTVDQILVRKDAMVNSIVNVCTTKHVFENRAQQCIMFGQAGDFSNSTEGADRSLCGS